MQKPQFLIGAASSGSGKTTFTIGLLRALRNRGMKVQPFKCGPDYLDTKHHSIAAGRESYNLDSFMARENHLREIYAVHSVSADACITEGVMGLFDGYDRMSGSSAEIAETLNLPVILIVNARSTAYSVAALLYGFRHFCPEVKIVGVIFNFVGSAGHYVYLQQACHDAGVEALGYLPKCKEIEIPSRHLGLNIDSTFCFDEFADRIANQMEQSVNITRLLELCSLEMPSPVVNIPPVIAPTTGRRISVAYDEAFNFIYPANIDILKNSGQVTFFSPLRDAQLPPSDFVYLPGGYPEFHLPQLAVNETMRRSILQYCNNQGSLLAECGGMMYLGEQITDSEGKTYPMCGYLPQAATMENMKLKLGYRRIVIEGQTYRGHEFHYSRIIPGKKILPSIAEVFNARDEVADTPVYRLGNVTAGYIHFYWGENGKLPI